MNVIEPLNITPAMLVSSNVPEPDPYTGEVAWTAATYTIGERRILAATHRIYECAIAGASTLTPNVDVARWLDVGPTNRWAMFDTLRNTATKRLGSIVVVIAPGSRVSSYALAGMQAEAAQMAMVSSAATVYNQTDALILRRTATASEYCFGAFAFKKTVSHYDIPRITGGAVTVTISRASGEVQCGALIIGNHTYIGQLQNDVEINALNFSKVERDKFGGLLLKQIRRVPKTNHTINIDPDNLNKLIDLFDRLDAIPAFYSGLDDQTDLSYYDALQKLGVYKSISFRLNNVVQTTASLELEEL